LNGHRLQERLQPDPSAVQARSVFPERWDWFFIHWNIRTAHRFSGKEEKPLSTRSKKDYYCNVVSEHVEICLKNKPYLSRKPDNELFVQCNQPDCQYVDDNQPPCPLNLDLFSEEIEKREQKRRDRINGF
jgi:hypothetical protein